MEGQQVIDIFENGRNQTKQIYIQDGPLVEFLVGRNQVCPMMGGQIKIKQVLGEGSFGTAYEVEIVGMEKPFVAKKVKADNKVQKAERRQYVGEIAENLYNNYNIPKSLTIRLNGGDPNRTINTGEFIVAPFYGTMCRSPRPVTYDRVDGRGMITFPAGSYICDTETYSEYVLGLMCGSLYTEGTSINFIETYDFATCEEQPFPTVSQYTFMEKIDGDLHSLSEEIMQQSNALESLYVQMIHAMVCYQREFNMVHGDAHYGNIFITKVKDDTMWKGRPVERAEWFHYRVDNVDLYIPATSYIAKIGDFGLSVRYKKPVIGTENVLKNGHFQYNFDGTSGAWIPNWYCQEYDPVYATTIFCYLTKMNDPFFTSILIRMLNLQNVGQLKKYYKDVLEARLGRPIIENLETVLKGSTPENIFKSKTFLGKYRQPPPPGSRVLTMGEIGGTSPVDIEMVDA